MLAPIALFVYNRPEHLIKTIGSLIKNDLAEKSDLFIFSDGPKTHKEITKIEKVRKIINQIEGFNNIIIKTHKQNLGLADSIISGVDTVLENHDKVIVVEDDLICEKGFIKFMNEALSKYEGHSEIISISGYMYPIKTENIPDNAFLLPRASSWGWGTWKKYWSKINWKIDDSFFSDKKEQKTFNKGGEDLTPMLKKQIKGEISSWAVRWSFFHYKENCYCLFPKYSLIRNIGLDGSGTHSPYNIIKPKEQMAGYIEGLPDNPKEYPETTKSLQKYFKLSIVRRAINYLKFK